MVNEMNFCFEVRRQPLLVCELVNESDEESGNDSVEVVRVNERLIYVVEEDSCCETCSESCEPVNFSFCCLYLYVLNRRHLVVRNLKSIRLK